MIYLDNAATTQIDNEVFEEMLPYLTTEYGNPGTLYSLGGKAADAVAIARQRVADMIGAKSEQIIFTSGGSEANNLAIKGVANWMRSSGKNLILSTTIEHDSIGRTLDYLKKDFLVSLVDPRHDGEISKVDVERCLEFMAESGAVPGLVSVMHTNNETGIANTQLSGIANIAHWHNALFHTDCVQAAGSVKLNVDEIGCDMMSISSHKIHGPKGVGALYMRDKSALTPLIHGGHSQEFGLRGGTENVAGIVGFGKACEIATNNIDNASVTIHALLRWFMDCLVKQLRQDGSYELFHINGDRHWDAHHKTISIRFDGIDGETLLLMLNSMGVCVSAGSACRSHEQEPSRVLTTMGIEPEAARNSIRISFSRMNTDTEVKDAAMAVAKCVKILHGEA